jgi:hypothetical protein
MRRVFLRPIVALALLVVLSAQGVAGEPQGPRTIGGEPRASRTIVGRIKHMIIVILDELGGPHP